MKIAFTGTGRVGSPLARRLAEAGHDVCLARADEPSSSLEAALQRSSRLSALPMKEALEHAEAVFLAIPFQAVEGLLPDMADKLSGKILVDCTNPVGPGLSHGLKSVRSGSEAIQSLVPAARVIKAFSIYGYENLEDPAYPDYPQKPVMMFCGDDISAKQSVSTLIADCGFEPFDVGPLAQALHLEHMTLLWVRMVRAGGYSPHMVWGLMRREASSPPR
ncbi:MAG: hypothetical protein GMKNLPBB_02633 [Myxococcota bacterium]|nr:hypothetical protein [Myxococcota bacterium]